MIKKFMADDFLLSNPVSEVLYNNFAKAMPIIDYHCHIPVKDICNDIKYNNISEIWLYADHYKWRAMRALGVQERLITGDATDREKFDAYISCLPRLVGNPLYHWSNMELRRYFNCDLLPTRENSDLIYQKTLSVLQSGRVSAKSLITESGVEALCTTDDPADTLDYHKKLALDPTFKTKVFPAFRPDKGMNPTGADFAEYIQRLGNAADVNIDSLSSLKAAYLKRLGEFYGCGMKTADHGFDDYISFIPASDDECDVIFKKALSGGSITDIEKAKYKSNLILFFAKEYKKHGTVMQIHYGVLRNPNSLMFKRLGPDSGYDTIHGQNCIYDIAKMLDTMNTLDSLPKTVLYSVNPADNAALDSLCAAFNGRGETVMQHGSAWWFNDTLNGIREQLQSLASLSALGAFIGMTTDSRSLLSYTRHDYFRRILCDMLGELVMKGEYPADYESLAQIVCDVSYNNVKRFFNF